MKKADSPAVQATGWEDLSVASQKSAPAKNRVNLPDTLPPDADGVAEHYPGTVPE